MNKKKRFTIKCSEFISLLKLGQLHHSYLSLNKFINSTFLENAIFVVRDSILYLQTNKGKEVILISKQKVRDCDTDFEFAIYLPEAIGGKTDDHRFAGFLNNVLNHSSDIIVEIDSENYMMIVKQSKPVRTRVKLGLLSIDEALRNFSYKSLESFVSLLMERLEKIKLTDEIGVANLSNQDRKEMGNVTFTNAFIKNALKKAKGVETDVISITFLGKGKQTLITYEKQRMGNKSSKIKGNIVDEGYDLDWAGDKQQVLFKLDVFSLFEIMPDKDFTMHYFSYYLDERDMEMQVAINISESTIMILYVPRII